MKKSFLIVFLTLVTLLPASFLLLHGSTHADGGCALSVPAHPLTAAGLATPYQLQTPCSETMSTTQAFVQGAVFDPDTRSISIYNPLVIDAGTTPAIAPVAPVLPPHAVVALWFGFNGPVLTLDGPGVSQCMQGMGQFAYCNAGAFFSAVNAAGITIPPLGVGLDGVRCPTVRDFSIVDQDQSDNVTTTYLVSGGQTAQNTAANRAALPGAVSVANGSDERLLTVVDRALGCTPFSAPDLADAGNAVPALPLNELQAAALQRHPIALVPAGDPFVGPNDLTLLNRYRTGVDQPVIHALGQANTTAYCAHLRSIAPARLALDKPFTSAAPSLDPAVANSLFTFLAQRFVFSYDQGLNCVGLLGLPDPVTLTQDGNGVTIDATIVVPDGKDVT